ncbi:MAG TPA: hypothetical protein VEK57_13470 [Thermoanaerobaculia bacterium]|nr:hypothetical protein [Thermoanaerobaculia bacterium]
MKKLLAVFLMFFSVTASAQWQPSGATSGPISYSGGNVGIGTATPAEPLHVAGNVRTGGSMQVGAQLVSPAWWNSGAFSTGYMKLVTPIVHNESNMFSIQITGYRYWGVYQVIDVRCNGYAYDPAPAPGSLIHQTCHADGTDLPVEIATEVRGTSPDPVVVIRIGNPDTVWYYAQMTFSYIGWKQKSAASFTWVKGETTPAIGSNMNSAVVDDRAGTLSLGMAQTSGTRLAVGGTSHLSGNAGIGQAPHATYRLAVSGAADTTTFPGTPSTMSIASNRPFSTANNGAGIAFNALYNSGGDVATIGAISALKESTSDGSYGGSLTFGTRQTGTGTGSMERMRIRSTGEVVIGQSGNTGTKLTINGDVVANGSITGVRVFNAVYQDIAEWVPATEDMTPGTVVVLSPGNVNEVMPSGRPYDTSVAGVVSEQPGVLLGVGGASKEQIATTGRVKVRVDATAAPIRIGDLLVTSGASGTAMKSIPVALGDTQIHRPGTIVGKALEPLDSGTGEILVLLSLQ